MCSQLCARVDSAHQGHAVGGPRSNMKELSTTGLRFTKPADLKPKWPRPGVAIVQVAHLHYFKHIRPNKLGLCLQELLGDLAEPQK